MMPRLHQARSTTIGLVAALLLGGCELALHEVQQGTTSGCDPWRAGCPALVEYAGSPAAHPPRVDLARLEIVNAAVGSPYRPCDGVGLVCQGRIIGDVLWDEYVMVLSGRSDTASTAASAQRAVPAAASKAMQPTAAAGRPAATQPVAVGRIVRTHGARAGEAATAAPAR